MNAEDRIRKAWLNERRLIIESGLLESWVNLHRTTTEEYRAVIKKIITMYSLNEEANEVVRKAHRKEEIKT